MTAPEAHWTSADDAQVDVFLEYGIVATPEAVARSVATEPDDEPDDLRPTIGGWLFVLFVAAAMFISAAALVWIAAAVIVAICHVPTWFGVVTVLGVAGLVVWAAMEKAR